MYSQDPSQDVNPKKLFVGNIAFSVTEDELRDLFGQHGEIVDLKLVIDRMTGRSRGIAFVEFATEDQAQAAMTALNEFEFNGRNLLVNVARPQAPRPAGERRFSPRGGGQGGYQGGGYRGGNSRGGDRGGYRGGNSYGRSDRDNSY